MLSTKPLHIFERVDAALDAAAGRDYTAAVARIEHRGTVVYERAFGTTRDDRLQQPVYLDTRFDLASITKLFVSTLALCAVNEGRIGLDTPLVHVIPEWRDTDHAPITLRMLLAHTSGMNSGADYRQLLGFNVIDYTLRRQLVAKPKEGVIYSDLGFIALGVILERIYGRSLANIHRGVLQRRTCDFRPLPLERIAIPATEHDSWRGRVQGFVHDEKAYLLGGVAGHAGLFGTAADVAWLTELYLGALCGRDATLLPHALVKEAVSEQAYDPVLRRGLGWALKTSDENSCGRYWAMETFGHTGFVGTCVWADPTRDVQAVLLTNSVYFGRKDTRDLRASFYEAVLGDLDLQ